MPPVTPPVLPPTDAPTFDPDWSAGVRTGAGFVGVDAGTMCLGTTFPVDDEWMDAALDGPGWSGPGWACSTSGYGDGGYDVLTVTDEAGTVVGVEVLFCSAAIDDAAAADLAATGVPEPAEADKRAVWDKTADADTQARYAAFVAADRDTTAAAWERLATVIDPRADSTPHPFTELTVGPGGALGVGDPCYGGPTTSLPLPAGRYVVVAWRTDGGGIWGARTARLGAYRIR